MYGLPKDFDASSFIGRTLEMVCFNLNQIYLHFDDHVMITIEGDLIYQTTPEKSSRQKISPPVFSTNLMELLEHKVTNASARLDGTLSLTFDNGCIVTCLDSSPNYESYRISFGDKTIIV
jgi:hypothetical protein